MSDSEDGGGSDDGFLTREQTQHMTDEEFFQAYQQGRIKRRADALTEDNYEEVRTTV